MLPLAASVGDEGKAGVCTIAVSGTQLSRTLSAPRSRPGAQEIGGDGFNHTPPWAGTHERGCVRRAFQVEVHLRWLRDVPEDMGGVGGIGLIAIRLNEQNRQPAAGCTEL